METLADTMLQAHDWAVTRINYLCDKNLEDAYAIQSEFSEWMDSSTPEVDVISLEYIGEENDPRSSQFF